MPIKRLTLPTPRLDSEGTEFPYVDVRLVYAGVFGGAKSGASLTAEYVVSPFTALLKIRYYRISLGARIFLAENYQPLENTFEARQKIRRPSSSEDLGCITNFWDYLYIGTTPSLAATYSFNMDDLREQSSTENPFEAIDINTPLNFRPMITCLAALLRLECSQDFAGISVVEDVA